MNANRHSGKLRIALIGNPEKLEQLQSAMSSESRVEVVHQDSSAEYAFSSISQSIWSNIEAVFIDPFADSFDPRQSSNFILNARATHPDVVFVLLASQDKLQDRQKEFDRALQPRILHYYFLDPDATASQVVPALARAVEACQEWRARERSVTERRHFEYDVAISFAGEDRDFAQSLADALSRRNVRVFLDDYYRAALWGRDLYTTLYDIYFSAARYCMILVSRSYRDKMWTGHERQAAQARALEMRGEEYILPIRLEDAVIQGIPPAVAYLSGDLGAEEIADLFVRKLASVTGSSPGQGERAGTDTPDGPRARERDAPGPGERLFTANVGEHSGKLAVAFGADDTLVITDQDGAIYRWSLSSRTALPGAPGSGSPPAGSSVISGAATQVAVSTAIPAVAVARGGRGSIVHFTAGGYHTSSFLLGRDEFLVPASGERFATHDRRRLTIRDFADGTVAWEQPCPRSIATAAIDTRGRTVAMAGASSWFAPSNMFVVTSQDDPRPHEFTFENIGVPGAGCQLGLAPGGELVVCSSFREILLARPGSGDIVRRRPIGSMREEMMSALGARPQRLICMADGQVLWLRGRRVVDVNWSGPKFRYLTQDGLCDDIAFDHATSRLAIASEAGQADVFEWRPAGLLRS